MGLKLDSSAPVSDPTHGPPSDLIFTRGKMVLLLKKNFNGVAAFLKGYNQSIFWGDPPIFLSFMSPCLPLFIAFLLINFRKFSIVL